MSQSDPEHFGLLIKVFHYGLRFGLISREEVVAWADEIIKSEDEPDYFFIEVSLNHDKNTLLSTLNERMSDGNETIALRVVLGLLYERLSAGVVDTDYVARKITKIDFLYGLTSPQVVRIYEFDDYDLYPSNPEQAESDLSQFLSRYKDLTLGAPGEWITINQKIEANLNEEDAHLVRTTAIRRINRQKKRRRVSIALLAIAAVVFTDFLAILGISDSFSLFLINFIGVCFGGMEFCFWKQKRCST